MKIKNLLKLYKISKHWDFVEGKLEIPDYDLDKLDIRQGNLVLDSGYNPEDSNVKGEFMPAMTEEDYEKWQQQKSGWQKFYDKVLGK